MASRKVYLVMRRRKKLPKPRDSRKWISKSCNQYEKEEERGRCSWLSLTQIIPDMENQTISLSDDYGIEIGIINVYFLN